MTISFKAFKHQVSYPLEYYKEYKTKVWHACENKTIVDLPTETNFVLIMLKVQLIKIEIQENKHGDVDLFDFES